MKRAPASSSVATAMLAVAIGAAWGLGIPAARAAQQEQPAVASTERIELEVVVTETDRYSGTPNGTSEGPRTWRVRALTTAGNRVRITGEAIYVSAMALLPGDGRVAVSLEVLAWRRSSNDGPTAINAGLDVVLDDGVPTIVAEASNPANDGVIAVEVTATLLDRPANQRAARPVAPIRVGGNVPPRSQDEAAPSPPAPGRPVAADPDDDAPSPAGGRVEPTQRPGR